jgi:hypothetical protein
MKPIGLSLGVDDRLERQDEEVPLATAENPTVAEICDRHRAVLATAFLAIGISSAAGATGHLVNHPSYLRWLEMATAAAGVLLIVGAMAWKTRRLQGRRGPYLGDQGFVAHTVTMAHVSSWSVTFILLGVMKVLVDDDTQLPIEFFLQTVLATMLVVHGAVFLFLNRSHGNDDALDDDRA